MAQPTEHPMLSTTSARQSDWLMHWRALVTLAVLGVLYSTVVALPTPAGLSLQGQRVLGVAVLAIGLWSTEALPMGVTGMAVVLLLVLSGGVPGFREALAGFAEPVTYFLMAVLTLGLAVLRSGLAERVARFFLRRCRGRARCAVPAIAPVFSSADTPVALGHHPHGDSHSRL